MKHKPKKNDAERSLLENITLLYRGEEFIWATYEEIKGHLSSGFEIFNDEKREIYAKK